MVTIMKMVSTAAGPCPKVRITMPSDLKNVENGKVPGALVKPVKFPWPEKKRTSFACHHRAAKSFSAFQGAFELANPGLTLGATGFSRSYTQQVTLFKSRYQTPPPKGSSDIRFWTDPTLKPVQRRAYGRFRGAGAAVPGTSNHGWWLAGDLTIVILVDGKPHTTIDLGGYPWRNMPDKALQGRLKKAVQWMIANALDYGLCWDSYELWHLQYFAGDQLPLKVYEFFSKGQPTLRVGSKGPAVELLQHLLVERAGQKIKIDGQFGNKTKAAVLAVEALFGPDWGFTGDGVAGPEVWSALYSIGTE